MEWVLAKPTFVCYGDSVSHKNAEQFEVLSPSQGYGYELLDVELTSEAEGRSYVDYLRLKGLRWTIA